MQGFSLLDHHRGTLGHRDVELLIGPVIELRGPAGARARAAGQSTGLGDEESVGSDGAGATGDADGNRTGTRLRQRATFVPRGLLGHLYWWAVAPFHGVVFGGMLRNVTRAAESQA